MQGKLKNLSVRSLVHSTCLQRVMVSDIRNSCPTLVRHCIDPKTQKSHLWSGKISVCAAQPVVVQCKARYTVNTEKSLKGAKRQDLFPFYKTAGEKKCVLLCSDC